MRAWIYRWIGALMIGLTLHSLIFHVVLAGDERLGISPSVISFILIVIGASLIAVEDKAKKDVDSADARAITKKS